MRWGHLRRRKLSGYADMLAFGREGVINGRRGEGGGGGRGERVEDSFGHDVEIA